MLCTHTDNYTIRYSAALSMVEIVWQAHVSSEQLQAGLCHTLEIIKLHQAQFLLINAQKVNSLKSDDQAWLKNFFLPELQKLKVMKFARITDPSTLTLAVIGKVLEYVQNEKQYDFKLKSFFERDKALDWLFETVTL